jgi:plasmid stabilization system protein ParE
LKTYKVVITDAAEADLQSIYDHIAGRASADTALRFVESIEDYCLGFSHVPERGTRRDELRPGLRTVGFRRRATILFSVDNKALHVVIHGIYYGGRNIPEDL